MIVNLNKKIKLKKIIKIVLKKDVKPIKKHMKKRSEPNRNILKKK